MYQRKPEADDVMYEDRPAAGRLLGQALAQRQRRFSVVLGLTRGGVPIAYEVSAVLRVPMDILVVKKLRSPVSDELAIGAICADGARVLREDIMGEVGVTQRYLDEEVRIRLAEAQELERLYRGGHPPIDVSGASVVIVDDGMATGSTMEAAVVSARSRGAMSVEVAVPVGSWDACGLLRRTADDVFCLETPYEFWGVGQFYAHFPPVANEEVLELLDANRVGVTNWKGAAKR
jgi:putative phosphoribosyl transferase